jgi:hypothetical protein
LGNLAILNPIEGRGVMDIASGRELRTLQGHTGFVESVAFSPNVCVVVIVQEAVPGALPLALSRPRISRSSKRSEEP